jgi:hypothetical protein
MASGPPGQPCSSCRWARADFERLSLSSSVGAGPVGRVERGEHRRHLARAESALHEAPPGDAEQTMGAASSALSSSRWSGPVGCKEPGPD